MPDVAGPFDGTNWFQAQWYRDAPMRESSGVYGTPPNGISGGNPVATIGSGDLPLTINGLSFTMGLGRAHIRGAGYERTGSAFSGSSPANTNASLSRIDRLVLRRDLAAKTITPVLLQGTPASSPSAPALQQVEDGAWDLPLFRWVVQPASSTVLTDVRDERRWAGSDGVPFGPRISGSFLRTDNTNNINAGDFTALRAVAEAGVGSWRVYNVGTGLGWENDIPGRYRVTGLLLSAITAARYEQADIVSGTQTGVFAVGGSGVNGFGGCSGYMDIDAPNGIQAALRYYNSGPAGTFRSGSRWSIEWLRPVV